MKPLFSKVVVIGLGLIGGSIALEAKKRRLAKEVIGISRSPENRRLALKRHAVDRAYPSGGKFLNDADLVILATPVRKIIPLLLQMKSFLKPQTLVTDVGSTKFEIVHHTSRFRGFHFIGGHPIAGTEQSGMRAAHLGLFKNKKWILTPTSQTPKNLVGKLSSWIRKLGAQVVILDPLAHDRIFALVSHLPNVLSYTLANTVEKWSRAEDLSLAGSSLKDMTRLALSPPEMWRDICLSNSKELLRAFDHFDKVFSRFKRVIQNQSSRALLKDLQKAQRTRKKWLLSCGYR